MLTKPDWKSMTADQKIAALIPILEYPTMNSASKIAAMFENASRNSIIAFFRRHGLKLPGARQEAMLRGIKQPKKIKRAEKVTITVKEEPPTYITHSPEPIKQSAAVPFLTAIERRLCKWPLWDSNHSIGDCCGLPRDGEGPYCAEHLGMSVGKGTPSERRAHRELKRLA